MIAYHDREWGVPVRDDCVLFEFLTLESAQAGLNWRTVLHKREGYRRAFSGFDPAAVAAYGAREVEQLLANADIVRNRLKIAAAIENAKGFLRVQEEFGSFAAYAWGFVAGKTVEHRIATAQDIPQTTAESETMSRDLRKRGFKFVGPTICYAFMQAVGMVNDHELACAYRMRLTDPKDPSSIGSRIASR